MPTFRRGQIFFSFPRMSHAIREEIASIAGGTAGAPWIGQSTTGAVQWATWQSHHLRKTLPELRMAQTKLTTYLHIILPLPCLSWVSSDEDVFQSRDAGACELLQR